ADALANRLTVLALDLVRDRPVEPLPPADLPLQVELRLAQLLDLTVRQVERLEQLVLGHLIRTGLDHRQAVERSDHDQIELARVPHVPQRRVYADLPGDHPDPHRTDRTQE